MAGLPAFVTGIVVSTDLLLAGLLVVGVDRAARRAGLATQRRTRVTRTTVAVVVLWLLVALVVARAALPVLHPAVLALIGGPILLGYTLFLTVPTWRAVVRHTPQSWLVGAQVYRLVGLVFLVVWSLGGLPAFFALPAGIGDALTGAGAVLVALTIRRGVLGWRAATVGWNLLGVVDLLVAFGAGSTLLAGPLSRLFAAETSTALITQFPLGLVPLFLVPTSILLHCYSLTNLYLDGTGVDATANDRAERASR